MGCGKTQELLRIVKEYERKYGKQSVMLFKHEIDSRDGSNISKSRNGVSYPAVSVKNSSELLAYTQVSSWPIKLVAIEEGQFFDDIFPYIVQRLVEKEGYDVVITGLNQSYTGEAFGQMKWLLAESDGIIYLPATCTVCGSSASKTQKLVNGKPSDLKGNLVVIDKTDETVTYEPRCRDCWVSPHMV